MNEVPSDDVLEKYTAAQFDDLAGDLIRKGDFGAAKQAIACRDIKRAGGDTSTELPPVKLTPEHFEEWADEREAEGLYVAARKARIYAAQLRFTSGEDKQ